VEITINAARRRDHVPFLRTLVSLTALLAIGPSDGRVHAESPTETKVKAAFVYNFAKFVAWPASAFPSPGAAFTICALGERPLNGALDETLKGKTVDDHALVIKHVDDARTSKGCQILFVPRSELGALKAIVGGESYLGVLTVSEAPEDEKRAKPGAMITLVLRDGRVRFLIDQKAAENAGLSISSKLMTLALREDE
jgi:hypothetical protein